MLPGMLLHYLTSTHPVYLAFDFLADRKIDLTVQTMQDALVIRHFDTAHMSGVYCPRIAWLTAAGRVESRPVEFDEASLVFRPGILNSRGEAPEIGIAPVKFLRHKIASILRAFV